MLGIVSHSLSLIHFLSVCPSVYMSITLSICLLNSLSLPVYLPPSLSPCICLPLSLSLSHCPCLSLCHSVSVLLPVSLSGSSPWASLSGLHGVRLANMDVGGGETKCSSQHKAALIRSPHPPQQSLITESWLTGIKTDS